MQKKMFFLFVFFLKKTKMTVQCSQKSLWLEGYDVRRLEVLPRDPVTQLIAIFILIIPIKF